MLKKISTQLCAINTDTIFYSDDQNPNLMLYLLRRFKDMTVFHFYSTNNLLNNRKIDLIITIESFSCCNT